MSPSEAKTLALSLMKKHGLIDKKWTFAFDRSKRRFGVCMYNKKVIGLSIHLTKLNDIEKVKNTILHEIAHALLPPHHHHDKVWVAKAKEIGCNGERCYNVDEVVGVTSKFVAVCAGCDTIYRRYKSSSRESSCSKCSSGKYNPTYKLNYVLNVKNI